MPDATQPVSGHSPCSAAKQARHAVPESAVRTASLLSAKQVKAWRPGPPSFHPPVIPSLTSTHTTRLWSNQEISLYLRFLTD